MSDIVPRAGMGLIVRAAYQTRAFLLSPGEVLPPDPREFDRASHPPKLVQLSKGERLVGLTHECAGMVFAGVERDGNQFACALLPGSFDVTG